MNDIVLYHGSRGGLSGSIKPISRERCDFGRGFYMGDIPEQVKGLVIEDADPIFYTLNLRLSEIPEDKILILDGMEWVYAVLTCRDKIKEFSELDIAKQIKLQIDNADIIIGPIADDRMNTAVARFAEGALTDIGLLECLRHVDYGIQYVAKTEFACSKIDIISEREIYEQESDDIRKYTKEKREAGKNVVKQAIRDYRKEGYSLYDIIQGEYDKRNLSRGEIFDTEYDEEWGDR